MGDTVKSLIKRTVLFLLLASFIIPWLGLMVGFPIVFIISPFIERRYSSDSFLAGLEFIYYGSLFASPFFYYLYAKIFGLFKFIDELKIKFFNKILLLIPICALLFFILNLAYFGLNNIQFNISAIFAFGFGLIPAFFLYKFFQYLTKKYPFPFEKIGYYCSIEFYKKLLKKN